MRHAVILPFVLAAALAAPLAAADIPDGSSATLTAVGGTGCIKIANGERVYYLPIHEVVGVQSKSNGCSVTMRTDKGVETRDFTTISADDFIQLMRLAR
jgi:hypothetical protein